MLVYIIFKRIPSDECLLAKCEFSIGSPTIAGFTIMFLQHSADGFMYILERLETERLRPV